MTSTADYAPFDYVDEDGASVIALRRKRDDSSGEEHTKRKLARLLSDLTWSMNQPSSNNLIDDSSSDHYEIRQVQQQINIEVPLSQPSQKPKPHYGK